MRATTREHRAYINIDVNKVADEVRLLSEDGILSDILHSLPNDNILNKIEILFLCFIKTSLLVNLLKNNFSLEGEQ